MPDFNIKNTWGQKIGSIEEKGPGFLDALAKMQNMQKMLRSAERVKLVEDFYADMSAIVSQVEAMGFLAAQVNLHGEIHKIVRGALDSWLNVMERTPFGQSERKMEKFHTNEILPLAAEIRAEMLEIYPTLIVFTQLNGLMALFNEYFEFHNESCNRLEAQGLSEIEIADNVFLRLDQNWNLASAALLDLYNEVVSLAARLDTKDDIENIAANANLMHARAPELQAQIDNLIYLTNGRERAAERVLASQSSSHSSISMSEELEKLIAMKDSGILTQKEFGIAKKKLLS